MKPLFSSLGSGLVALGLAAGVTTPSSAGPIQPPDLSTVTSTAAPTIIPVRDSWAGGNDRQMYDWRWRRGDFRWRGRHFSRDWDGDWRFRHHHRHFCCGGDFDGGDALLGLGLGLGLGALAYNYYNPYYYAPYPRYYYAPRRIYRTERLSEAHVRWCYDRYRSYRAWDNTFQPIYGPRRQCISPYG
ncbi:BA14K family protein [Mesorhizobium sp. ORS 3428]|uniref:BA14K family protein n=1 Tax=Mesorhizobium sp. ORS 3428 TaxID=540997 RepID=UPI0008DAB3A7|nr:BA14K family protein [Mesorhizobium sp. ORS 3428]OHV90837.1 hypothetical protein ORS3428_01445 [Mesorhizobium sp. ORS 3428]